MGVGWPDSLEVGFLVFKDISVFQKGVIYEHFSL